MNLNPKLEKKLKEIAIKYLEKGKPRWDVPHTLATVYWMRKLIEKEGGDERILVTAMYLHDIGYPRLQKGYNFDEMIESKKNHAEIGAEEAKKILRELKYSPSEIKEIAYLIGNHYKKENINTHNMQLVLEADGLGKIDWERVPPNFNKESLIRYIEYFKKRIVDKFKTETGRKNLKKLLKKTENYPTLRCVT